MKKILCSLLAVVIVLVVSGCSEQNQPETSSNPNNIQAPEITEPKKDKVSATIPYLTTDDWISFDFTKKDGNETLNCSVELPDGTHLDNTVILDKEDKKVAEIVGCVLLKDNQKPFDNVQLNKNESDVYYNEKSSGFIGDYKYESLMGIAATEMGNWNVYCYALHIDDAVLLITIYSFENLNPLPDEYKQMLASIELK